MLCEGSSFSFEVAAVMLANGDREETHVSTEVQLDGCRPMTSCGRDPVSHAVLLTIFLTISRTSRLFPTLIRVALAVLTGNKRNGTTQGD